MFKEAMLHVDQDKNLEEPLQGIVLNADNMRLRHTEVACMGHLLSSGGLRPDPAKVEASIKMQTPAMLKECKD